MTVIPIVIGSLGTLTKQLIQRLGGLENKRTSGDHPNYYIIEKGRNVEESPGDLKRFAVTQTPVKNHQLTLM